MSYCFALLVAAAICRATPASLPLFFEENRGQSAPEVRFEAPGSNHMFFTEHELSSHSPRAMFFAYGPKLQQLAGPRPSNRCLARATI